MKKLYETGAIPQWRNCGYNKHVSEQESRHEMFLQLQLNMTNDGKTKSDIIHSDIYKLAPDIFGGIVFRVGIEQHGTKGFSGLEENAVILTIAQAREVLTNLKKEISQLEKLVAMQINYQKDGGKKH